MVVGRGHLLARMLHICVLVAEDVDEYPIFGMVVGGGEKGTDLVKDFALSLLARKTGL